MPATDAAPPLAILLNGADAMPLILGAPAIAWQARAVRSAGGTRALVVGRQLPEPLASRVGDGLVLERVAEPSALGPLLSGNVLLLAEGLLIDPRALRRFLQQAHAPALLIFAHWSPDGAERLDRDSHWAGVALLPAAMVADTAATLGDWEFAATMLRVADAAGAQRIALETLDLPEPDDPDRRLASPLLWARPADDTAAERAAAEMLAASVPVGPDLADRWLHRPVALKLAGWLATTPPAGPALRWLALAMILLAVPLFFLRFPWLGLALLLLAPLLDEAGRTLAAAHCQPTPRALPAEVVRTPIVALAIAAMAPWVAPELSGWLMAGALLLFTALRCYLLEWYRRRVGSHLDQQGRADAQAVALMGPATSLSLPMLPFAVAGQWWPGLVALAAWSILLFLIAGRRFLRAMDAALPPAPA